MSTAPVQQPETVAIHELCRFQRKILGNSHKQGKTISPVYFPHPTREEQGSRVFPRYENGTNVM